MLLDFALDASAQALTLAIEIPCVLGATALLKKTMPAGFAALGWRGIGRAYLWVLGAAATLAAIEAHSQGRAQVAQGILAPDHLLAWAASSFLYLLAMMQAIALPLLAVLIAPATLWLLGRRQASLAALLGLGTALATLGALWTLCMPGSAAALPPLAAVAAFMSPLGIGLVILPLVFGIGCQLPAWIPARPA
ncbi:hypothetical protein HSX11_11900 [Oxalobacteraceae bacterium]|nr:hypothetical protein [Oxalobacteraceae bacterium]